MMHSTHYQQRWASLEKYTRSEGLLLYLWPLRTHYHDPASTLPFVFTFESKWDKLHNFDCQKSECVWLLIEIDGPCWGSWVLSCVCVCVYDMLSQLHCVSEIACKHRSQVFDAEYIWVWCEWCGTHHHHCCSATPASISIPSHIEHFCGALDFEHLHFGISESNIATELITALQQCQPTVMHVRKSAHDGFSCLRTSHNANTFESSPAPTECKTNKMKMCSNARARSFRLRPHYRQHKQRNICLCIKLSGWSEVSLLIDNVNEFVKLT